MDNESQNLKNVDDILDIMKVDQDYGSMLLNNHPKKKELIDSLFKNNSLTKLINASAKYAYVPVIATP